MKKPRSRRKPAAYVAAFALLAGAGVIAPQVPASADPIGENECFPAVLMLRGSGEDSLGQTFYPEGSNSNSAFISTNGHEGELLGRALEAMATDTDPAKTVSKLRFIGVDYPALAVEAEQSVIPSNYDSLSEPEKIAIDLRDGASLVSHPFKYLDSITEGAKGVLKVINDDIDNSCNTQYLLMGYSQGALSARIAMNLMGNNTDKILGSYLIGDPYQKADGATANQRSLANTGYERYAPLRKAFGGLIGHVNIFEDDESGITENTSFYNNLIDSDATAYHEDLAGVTSRSLCHQFDMICWARIVDAKGPAHTNYFLKEENRGDDHQDWELSDFEAGENDLLYDIAGFDSQLQKLAASQTSNPRTRSLQSSGSVIGSQTVYHVANKQKGDLCSWDEGSDGNYEIVNAICDSYSADHEWERFPKMTVKILDSFGIEYVYSTSGTAIDPKIVEALAGVPYDRWVRFASLSSPSECLTRPVWWEFPVYSGPYSEPLETSPCLSSPSQGYSYDATQMFKRVLNEGTGLHKDHFVWGYDDDYIVDGADLYNPGSGVHTGAILNLPEYKDPDASFNVFLAQVRNGVPYYSISAQWVSRIGCFAQGESEIQPCDSSNENQLFKIEFADPSEQYGSLSLEKDITAPNDVTGFTATDESDGTTTFSWDPTVDDRMLEVRYYEIEQYDSYSETWEMLNIISGTEATNFNWSSGWFYSKYRISAVDYAYNRSNYVEIDR